MIISLNWLGEYIAFSYTPEELAHRLTMIGLEVEEIINKSNAFSGIVVGKVLEVQDHPNADRLKVCKVDSGRGIQTVVCGAPNVSNNQLVPLAMVGASIGTGDQLKSVTLRGVKSDGMLCSEKELGISKDHSGIMILNPSEYKVGQKFAAKSNNSDTSFVINVTPNRPDCLSHIGIAREVAALEGKLVSIPETEIVESETAVEDKILIEIQDAEACPRYCARVIENVKIEESPEWLKNRLESVGIRSINNVVDVTNYVLMETGHPLHAFNYDFIEDKKIVVRKAHPAEKFITLDQVERNLNENDLLICNGQKPVALAGIMGGLNSEVMNTTKNILLESAYFDPMTIRRSAKRLNLSTEASYRFERGADPENTIYAINRAASLIADLAGGEVAKGIFDNNPKIIKPWNVSVRVSRVNSVLGSNISRDKIVTIFNNLGLSVDGNDPLIVTIPTFRTDLLREIDLIEEVIRFYGFDIIEPSTSTKIPLNDISNGKIKFLEQLRDLLSGIGFNEVINTSMVSEKHINLLKTSTNIEAIKIKNPLSPETAFMRTSLIPGLLDSVRWNHNRSNANVHLFETGRVIHKKINSLPDETLMLTGAISGRIYDKITWKNSSQYVDFYYIKGIVEYLLAKFHIYSYSLEKGEHPILDPLMTQKISISKDCIGYFGTVKDEILKSWDIDGQLFVFDLDVDKFFKSIKNRVVYSLIPKFPGVKRDIAIIVDENIIAKDINNAIISKGGNFLKSVEFFDLYRGKQIPEGKKSLAFTMTFLSEERTLREEEVDLVIRDMVKYLDEKFSASLRST